MKLSLMIINLLTEVFLDKTFRPKADPSLADYEAVLKLAHDAGYQTVDMTNLEYLNFGTEKVKELMAKYELACGSVILFDNFTCIDPEMQKELKARTQKNIDETAAIGGKTMMLVTSGAQPGLSREELQRGLAENLSAAAAYAKDKGITICIEDYPSTTIPMCSIPDIKYLLAEVDGLKLTYDSANMLVEGAAEKEFYDTFKDQIGYVHLKDVRIATEKDLFGDQLRDGRKMITTYHGEGIIHLMDVMHWLKEDGYKGYLSVEYDYDGKEKDLLEVLIEERLYLEKGLS